MVDVADKPQDGTNPGLAPADGSAQAAKPVTQEALDAVIADRRKANHEAQEAKKRIAELEAKNKAFEDAQKTEAQKTADDLAATKKTLAEKDAALAKQMRLNAALRMGASDPEFVAWKLETSGLDPEDEATVTKLKAEHPAIFGGNPAPTRKPGAAAGGPISGDKRGQLTKDISDLEKTITDAQKLGRSREVFGLLQQRNAKLEELAAL